MHFADLPIDILALIADYLIGNDIIKLTMAGSMALHTKLNRAVRILQVELPRFALYPVQLFNWPSVTSLDISLIPIHNYYPLTLQSGKLLPDVPQNHLLKLHLNCAQSFDLLDTHLAQLLLPNLQELDLSGTKRPIFPEMFAHLPKSLLKLRISSDSSVRATVPYTVLSSLPSHLELLEIPNLVNFTCHEDEGEQYTELRLPHSLKAFHVRSFQTDAIFQHLPPHLESLEISCLSFNRYGPEFVPLSQLPPTLTSIRIYDNAYRPILLDVPFNVNSRYIYIYAAKIPENPLDDQVEDVPHLGLVPPRVSFARLGYEDLQPEPRHPDATHEGITELELFHNDPLLMRILPPNLLSLESQLSTSSDEYLDRLPASLKSLRLRNVDSSPFEFFSSLPRGLTRLLIDHHSPGVRFEAEDLRRLPDTLTEMRFKSLSLDHASALSGLPASLISLTILYQGGDTAANKAWKLQGFSKYLPRGLRSLQVQHFGSFFDWASDIVAPLSERTPYLESLEVVCYSRKPIEEMQIPKLDFQCIGTLPKSLLHLTLPAPPSWTNDTSILGNLPKGLQTLMLEKIAVDQQTALQDEHFTNLPTSLTSLDIPSDALLTSRFWQVIPDKLRVVNFVTVSQPVSTDAHRREYLSRPHWQGVNAQLF